MKNFKNILGSAVVAIAGLGANQTAEAQVPVSKNKLETSAKAEKEVNNMETLGKSLFEEHAKELIKLGVNGIEIVSSLDPQKLISGRVTANDMTTITVNFTKNGNKLPGYALTIVTITSQVQNKYNFRSFLNEEITSMIKYSQKKPETKESAPVNSSGNSGVPVQGNLKIDLSEKKRKGFY